MMTDVTNFAQCDQIQVLMTGTILSLNIPARQETWWNVCIRVKLIWTTRQYVKSWANTI